MKPYNYLLFGGIIGEEQRGGAHDLIASYKNKEDVAKVSCRFRTNEHWYHVFDVESGSIIDEFIGGSNCLV